MFERLRLDAVIGGHDQQGEIDAARPGQHGVHEALMARDIDDTQDFAAFDRQIGEAQIDGNAPRLLLLQPVAVDPGQRLDQRCLAMIDMAGGADDHGAASGSGVLALCSASAIASGGSAARTGPRNGAARVLPPARPRSSQVSAMDSSCGTPLPR